ncbi:MAG TPA: hypothetical protein VJ964_00600 [Balneolaceae bacterium]|nr:hypothetical protein [Balneolaceae bacterium]
MKKKQSSNHIQKEFSYRGFEINYTYKILDRIAKDYMFCQKWVSDDEAQKELITFDAIGDSFKEAKAKICGKIDAFIDQ